MRYQEYFSLESEVVLSQLPEGQVNIVIPEQFINRLTGEIYIDMYIKWLAYGDGDMTIEYESGR